MYVWLLAGMAGLFALSQNKAVTDSVKGMALTMTENWTRWDADFKREAGKYSGMDWRWLKAIALNESSLGMAKSVELGLREPSNVDGSKSYDGLSWGLMQVTLKTAQELDPSATPAKLNNPQYSIAIAAKYLSRVEKTLAPKIPRSHPRWLEFFIKSYNQGPGNSLKELEGIRNEKWKAHVDEYWARFQRNLERVKASA